MTRIMGVLVRACLLLVGALAAGCGARTAPVFFNNPLPLLTWIGEFTRPAGSIYPELGDRSPAFGGISGLAPDARTQQWIAVSDDRAPSRVAWLSLSVGAAGLEVAPQRMQAIHAAAGVDARRVTAADLESIVALADGTFVLGEEGHRHGGETWPPALLHMNSDGIVMRVIEYPKEFQISGDGTSGLRDNQGFEGLAVTPRGRLIAGLEQPLIQDGAVTFERGAWSRLVEFEPSGATFRPGRQWRYMLSPTPRVENFEETCADGENGLVELLALSETTLLAMERACLISKDRQFTTNAVQLFAVELIGSEARKRPLLNFDSMTFRLSPALARLENFEALAFGPMFNGRPTLLVASDDNFRASQKTAFLLFGMR
jgi:hypothetical protein